MKLTLDNPTTVARRSATGSLCGPARPHRRGAAGARRPGRRRRRRCGRRPGDAGAQAERIFEIIGGLLAAHGANFADVAHIRTFMTDLDDLPAYGAVRDRLFPHGPGRIPPASTTVQVSRLFLPGAVLEVEVTAHTG